MDTEYSERRQRQRFQAVRDGKPCFFVLIGEARIPLIDLSLEGFAIAADAGIAPQQEFDFVLRLSDIPDKIRGRARAMNKVPGEGEGQIGCRFESFEREGAVDLKEWLTAHVISTASVRISEKEATAIVTGRSLI